MPEEMKSLQTRYEYLEFVRDVTFIGKTTKWLCQTRHGVVLGSVGWHCAWRQYCYFPKCQAVYSAGCLSDIAEFLKQLNEDYKRKKEDRKMSSLQRTIRRRIERMNWHPNKWYQLAIEEWSARKKRAEDKLTKGFGKPFTEEQPKQKKYRRAMGHKKWWKIQRKEYLKQQREQAAQEEKAKEQKAKATAAKPARRSVARFIQDKLSGKRGKS